MRHLPLICLLTASAFGLCTTTLAQVSAVGSDDRIRNIKFDDGAVVQLDTCLGFQTMLSFADNEKVENIAIGDAAQWQATPNKRGNIMFIKPFIRSAHTNMTVVTDKRNYSFELNARDTLACKRGEVTYDLRFQYDPEPAAMTTTADGQIKTEPASRLPEKRNTDYTFSGQADLVPLRVFDDGTSTYMRWSQGLVIPAIYAFGYDGSESMVNFAHVEGYIVIEQIAPAFVLRTGEARTVLYNEGFTPPQLDANSPRPRPEPEKKKFSLFGSKPKTGE
ncbi:TrbG/VirB9 family P-type conjugative transfer protein [Asticcacaulis endophyticus]|uniref:P-type conjugative transfer protein VirB9 n=1 Tax=Asticcacaulis endophyticus TaxID=1395890 RepID=A0A918UNZ5_9CAUL|nr:TrbG/VirB9 family P-type conjugative transfer protein [Asticcacaulis endophyticus]GGZ23970.1 P-type conjugative transfer protein VirB9 [Asticcacaulis endophyticus]